MPIASLRFQKDAHCQMFVYEDRIAALVPQGQGIVIPFRFDASECEAPGTQSWDLSYLYAELWVARELGPQLIAPALPEFFTESFRPSALRFPLTQQAVALLEEVRVGGDLRLTLHIQATLVGTAPLERVPDPDRRQTLEVWGLEEEIMGPVRSSDDVTIHIAKLAWEEEILPQWSQEGVIATSPPTPAIRQRSGVSQRLDIYALARTLCRATPDADFEGILEQCRAPIVGL